MIDTQNNNVTNFGLILNDTAILFRCVVERETTRKFYGLAIHGLELGKEICEV